jgi:DNA-nicking Smr family endonuclease
VSRRLSSEERALWDTLRRTVDPLQPKRVRKRTPEGEPSAAGPPAAPPEPAKTRAVRAARPQHEPPKAPVPQSPAALDEKTLRRLGRGLVAIDARIDLHGMRQERAFAALTGFLRREQARGARVVLIVTGKGSEERGGVLRASVPHWLARADLRPLVVGFSGAGRRHGGAGALYVRLRRRREAGRRAAAEL